MSAFDSLHPGLQHHIVNSLGWKELRPFQEEVIPTVLAGEHVLIIAPTAGGKTEAAILPVMSRMLTEDWHGLSTIYLCPIRALLNNLHDRLSRYATLIGRTCSVWHGDTSPTERARVGRDLPDILLTTPESLELMLVSRKTDSATLFGQVRTVVVDELHAFARDDRGWHLLSVLQRVAKLSGRELQRIGLSATVGNPDTLLRWLVSGGKLAGRVVAPPQPTAKASNVQLDFVGSIKNSAVVVSRLHRGEKRLVFVDSRARAEELGSELRNLDVKTFVTHSSLSKDQRTRAETAFASETDCVIVATSVLELGVDVGDLDRVIQIDSPATVSSFLQRMGRTGRRAGLERNCLFLATHDFGLLQSAALLNMWAKGYVEEVIPPAIPYHVFVQQFLALILQSPNFVRSDWRAWIGDVPAFADFRSGHAEEIISYLLSENWVCEDNGVLSLGAKTEQELGHRNFSELLSVITSRPLFQVRFGRLEIGFVHPLSFAATKQGPKTIALGGRGWRIIHVDWNRKIAHVEPSQESGRSRWDGSGVPLSAYLCESVRQVLRSTDVNPLWSRRATDHMAELRLEFAQVCNGGSTLVRSGSNLEWWTFAGLAANQTVVQYMLPRIQGQMRADNFCIRMPSDIPIQSLNDVVKEFRDSEVALSLQFQTPAEDLLKFSKLLPPMLFQELMLTRLADVVGAKAILASNFRVCEL